MSFPGKSEYAAECFWPGVSEAALAELDARIADVEAEDVRYLGSMLLPNDEVVFCFFDGPSVEAVQAVAERARIPFERIVRSVLADPEGRDSRTKSGGRR